MFGCRHILLDIERIEVVRNLRIRYYVGRRHHQIYCIELRGSTSYTKLETNIIIQPVRIQMMLIYLKLLNCLRDDLILDEISHKVAGSK